MTFTLTLGLVPLVLIGVSVILFGLATWACASQGLFEGSDTFGVGAMFTLVIYAVLWAIPSLIAWAVYATWFKP